MSVFFFLSVRETLCGIFAITTSRGNTQEDLPPSNSEQRAGVPLVFPSLTVGTARTICNALTISAEVKGLVHVDSVMSLHDDLKALQRAALTGLRPCAGFSFLAPEKKAYGCDLQRSRDRRSRTVRHSRLNSDYC